MFLCKNYKKDLLIGLHSINDQFYIALFNGKINKNIKSYYDLKNEIPEGNGYNIGGKNLLNAEVIIDGDTAILNFENPVWVSCSFEVSGALIYNNSLKDKNGIGVILFDEIYQTNYDDFIIQFPEPTRKKGFIKIR